MINEEDARNLLALIAKTPIVGAEAEVVAMLKHKLRQIKDEETPEQDN